MVDRQHTSKEFESQLRSACLRVSTLVGEGHGQPAQLILSQFPELAADEESALEIIYTEFQALERLGQRPPTPQWLGIYPQHRARLERLIKLHDLMDESEAEDASVPQSVNSTNLGSIGNYQLLNELGRGGMGVVYRARQKGLGRQVAVKVLSASETSISQRSRFLQEAESIAALQHPHIVQIFEIGVDQGRDFLSMELIEGGSLESWMQGPERSNHEIALLIKYLAEAIGFAHAHGIVHRDLKPANVLLTVNNEPKVVDFGLAKRMDDSARALTQTGAVLGTPSYMSPEQASGDSREVGPASDIFSIGVILYQLLTRQLPFHGQSAVETLKLIVEREPVAPSKLQRAVSRDLETICCKCLEKQPKQRYADAKCLVDDLTRFLDHRPILARRAGVWEKSYRAMARHREVSILAAALVLLTGVGLSMFLWQRSTLRAAQREADAQTRLASAQEKRASEAEEAYEASLKQARVLLGRTTDIGVKLEYEPGFDQTRRKAFEDAVNYYEEFLQKHDSDPAIRIEAAQAAMRSASLHADLGMWTEAEGRLKQANQWLLELQAERSAQWLRSDCLLQLANAQRRLERWSESEATFNQLIDMLKQMLTQNPSQADAMLRLANAQANLCTILGWQARWNEALPIYLDSLDQCLNAARITAKLPTPAKLDQSKVAAELVKQRVDQSAELRQLLLEEPATGKRSLPINALAELALSLDDIAITLKSKYEPNAAELCLREALSLRQLILENTTNNRFMEQYAARSMTNLAAHLIATGRAPESLELLRPAEKLYANLVKDFPERINYRTEWARSLIQTARSLNAQQRYDEAIEIAKQAVLVQEQVVAQHPGNQALQQELANSLVPLAFAYYESGHVAESNKQYRRAMEVRPEMAEPYNNLAWQLAVDTNSTPEEFAQAVQYAKKAVDLARKNANYWNTLTLALYRTGATSEALTAADRSLELSKGGRTSDWFFQAMLQARLGKTEEAQTWFQRAEARRQAEAASNRELIQFAKEAADAIAGAAN